VGGKQKLVEQLDYAAQHVGFFYVKNFSISQEAVDRQFALGREFYDLPLEEKLKYHNLQDLQSGWCLYDMPLNAANNNSRWRVQRLQARRSETVSENASGGQKLVKSSLPAL